MDVALEYRHLSLKDNPTDLSNTLSMGDHMFQTPVFMLMHVFVLMHAPQVSSLEQREIISALNTHTEQTS